MGKGRLPQKTFMLCTAAAENPLRLIEVKLSEKNWNTSLSDLYFTKAWKWFRFGLQS